MDGPLTATAVAGAVAVATLLWNSRLGRRTVIDSEQRRVVELKDQHIAELERQLADCRASRRMVARTAEAAGEMA